MNNGKVSVKDGRRIYSSCPGIYINQLNWNSLGILHIDKNLVIDPVLPKKLERLNFEFAIVNYEVTFKYHLMNESDNGQRVRLSIIRFVLFSS
ncbi:hypothetical protein [Bacillus sp. AFS053548]|uniref:hypothetical protein n=1 Tax=Bacillus sp. AFS053548 TaxID=2033505 RepID=UPI000BFBCAD4|nr:hypothetical protein [Bacillus sp. AFS053548]PGM59632.1 hypothetical protein CN946_01430 [Bacillus sp. AFS053548]